MALDLFRYASGLVSVAPTPGCGSPCRAHVPCTTTFFRVVAGRSPALLCDSTPAFFSRKRMAFRFAKPSRISTHSTTGTDSTRRTFTRRLFCSRSTSSLPALSCRSGMKTRLSKPRRISHRRTCPAIGGIATGSTSSTAQAACTSMSLRIAKPCGVPSTRGATRTTTASRTSTGRRKRAVRASRAVD